MLWEADLYSVSSSLPNKEVLGLSRVARVVPNDPAAQHSGFAFCGPQYRACHSHPTSPRPLQLSVFEQLVTKESAPLSCVMRAEKVALAFSWAGLSGSPLGAVCPQPGSWPGVLARGGGRGLVQQGLGCRAAVEDKVPCPGCQVLTA